jgi:hypothetical protein
MTHAAPPPGPSQPIEPHPDDPVRPVERTAASVLGLAAAPAEVATIRPGPGVIPPFVAPPREGVKRRRWIGIGIGAAVAVLCCGGGGAGLVGVVITTEHQRISDARTVVTTYVADKQKQDFSGAYLVLCEQAKDQFTQAEFAARVDQESITDFVVGTPSIPSGQSQLQVPVSVDFDGGDQQDLTYDVVVDADGSSRVCGPQL